MNNKRKIDESQLVELPVEDVAMTLQLFPVRIIPVDVGYKIDTKKQTAICEAMSAKGLRVQHEVRLFGEDAILGIKCSDRLYFYLFADGVGVFSYQDDCVEFASVEALDAESVLTERRNAHRGILSHTHPISRQLDDVVDAIRNLEKRKKRRKTSYNEWESGGLSYVMSFYLLYSERNIIDNPGVQEWLGNLLFTDRHTYFGAVSDYFEHEKRDQILKNIDVLNNIHVCHSWATMIALGELPPEHRVYYMELEVVLQHIWMYAYITEQNIDMFLAASDKKISSQRLTDFYDTLIDMTLIVKKYDTIINSTVHERELRIFEALKESSKLEALKKGIDDKSKILESKLSWTVNQKRLKSDRNTELFITLLTILEVLSGFGLGMNDFTKPYVWISISVCLLAFILYRMRD